MNYKTRRPMMIAIIALLDFCVLITGLSMLAVNRGYREAREGYDALREYAPRENTLQEQTEVAQPMETAEPAETPEGQRSQELSEDMGSDEPMEERHQTGLYEPLHKELLEINGDYIGWIRIAGMTIDYPVVQARNNDKYLSRTFWGTYSGAGSIFMDYRIKDGFSSPFAVIYGHNMRDASMFAPLHNYLDDIFLDENSEITIFTSDGEMLFYQVFYAGIISVEDNVFNLLRGSGGSASTYFAKYGAPESAVSYLVLTTCDGDETYKNRMLVYAARVEAEG